jgi:hypothetical protein
MILCPEYDRQRDLVIRRYRISGTTFALTREYKSERHDYLSLWGLNMSVIIIFVIGMAIGVGIRSGVGVAKAALMTVRQWKQVDMSDC